MNITQLGDHESNHPAGVEVRCRCHESVGNAALDRE